MRTPPDKRIILTLYSHPTKDLKLRWKAQVTFEPGSDDRSAAALTIADGEGVPVPEGVFEFAGCRIQIVDGRGEMNCGDFVRGRHSSPIWLYRKGVLPIPGALTFE